MSVESVLRYVAEDNAHYGSSPLSMLVMAAPPFKAFTSRHNISFVSAADIASPLHGIKAFQMGQCSYQVIVSSVHWLAYNGWMVRYGTAWCHALAARLLYPTGRFCLYIRTSDKSWDENDDIRFAAVGLIRCV